MKEKIKSALTGNEAKALYILVAVVTAFALFVWLSIITEGLVFIIGVATAFFWVSWRLILAYLDERT